MTTLAKCLIGLVALVQTVAFGVEMFLWGPDRADSFNFLKEHLFNDPGVAVMAHNQGLYNAFLAIGLIWALMETDARHARRLAICFTGFVFIAGLYGTLGTVWSDAVPTFWFPLKFQALPAGVALAVLMLDRSRPA